MAIPLNVLHIASTYPSCEDPIIGVYYKRQIEALPKDAVSGVVVTTDMPSLRGNGWLNLFRHWWKLSLDQEAVPVLRRAGWNVPGLSKAVWTAVTRRLCVQAVEHFAVPQIIHAHNTRWAGVVASELGRRWSIPWVISEHSTWFLSHARKGTADPSMVAALKGASEVIVVGKRLFEAVKSYSGRGAEIVPNVVDCDFFTLPPLEKPCNEFRVLFVGGLIPTKNVTGLVRAFASAFQKTSEARLEIVGAGSERESVEAEARRAQVYDRLEMRGCRLSDGVRDAMWRADVLCVPSHYETFCIVAAEAMSTGLPVIATRCGGPEDFVSEDLGWLVTTGDESALARALREAYEQRTVLRASQHLRRNRIKSACSGEAVSQSLLQIYRRVARPYPVG